MASTARVLGLARGPPAVRPDDSEATPPLAPHCRSNQQRRHGDKPGDDHAHHAQADWKLAPKTWEARIGLVALQRSESATVWARPLSDGRQDVRRFSQIFSYDAHGAPRSTTEDNGDGSTYTYTITERANTGAVKEAIESATDEWSSSADSKTWSFVHDQYGLYAVEATNPLNHVSKTRFDYASGQPVRTEDPDGVVTLATYDAFGRLASQTVEKAETSLSYVWKSASPVTVALPGNRTGIDNVRVNASYRVVETTTRATFTEVSGETWFDPAGRVVRSAHRGPLGDMVWTERVYDERGRLTVETRPHADDASSTQGAIVVSYDGLDRPTRATRPNDTLDGTRWTEAQYGSVGDPGALGAWLNAATGRVRAIRQHTSDSERAALVRTFDEVGRLASSLEQHEDETITPTSTYAFGLGQPMAITGPDGATLRTDFDSRGRALKTSDPSAGTSSWRYDGFGRLREERDNSTVHTIDYDLLDRPVLHTRSYKGSDKAFGADKTTTWVWDALPGEEATHRGKLRQVFDSTGFAETYTYEGPFGLQDSVTRTVPRPSAAPLALQTNFEYDGDGRLAVLRHPGDQRAQTYHYNERGALKSIDATMNGTTAKIWQLDKVYEGRLPSEVSLLQGKLTRTYYKGTGALEHLTMKVGQAALVDETLRYNESGLLEEHTDLTNSTTESFFYDHFRRLHEKRKGAGNKGAVLESFAFSPGGRITQKNGATLKNTVADKPAPWPDAVKRLEHGSDTVDYGYHPSYGLMTSIRGSWKGKSDGLDIRYDVDRQVREVEWDSGVKRTLGYAPTGDRASMHETGGDAESFVAYAGPHYERVESGANVAHVFRFTDGGGSVIAEERVEEQTLSDGTPLEQSLGFQHLARDYKGSVAAILPSGGEVTRRAYEAFGAASNATGTDLGYTGHRHLQLDESPFGLIDMGGRMFDPLSAQFTRADPFMPNADTPKGFNRFAYLGGDPINFTDPTGFRPDCNPNLPECGGGNNYDYLGGSVGGAGGFGFGSDGTAGWGGSVEFWTFGGRHQKRVDRRAQRRADRRYQREKWREQHASAAEKRYNRGRVNPNGGGNAPNTSSGFVDQVISAVDRNHLRALNAVSEAITGAGDFLTFGGSAWVRNKLFGEGAIRTDTAASYVGAGAGFWIGGGVRAIMSIPNAVRAIPGVVRAGMAALRATPGAFMAAGRGVANFLVRHVGVPGLGTGGVGIWRAAQAAATGLPTLIGQVRALRALGLNQAATRAFLAGEQVAFETPGVVGFAQMQGNRLVAGIFSINGPGQGVRLLAQFRTQAVAAGRALGATELEMVGAEFTNSALRAMLVRQGFTAATMEAPAAIGGGIMNVVSKVFGL